MDEQQVFATALLNPEHPCPAGVCSWNDTDTTARFGVYRNNVIASLIDALADSFTVTRALVGDDFFRAMARQFVVQHPPQDKRLAYYGNVLPDFIANFQPAAGLPYLGWVARLEMSWIEAYHAADAAPLAPTTIQRALADPETLPEISVTLHPSLQVIASPYAIVSLWAAHQDLLDITGVDPGTPETALVLRDGLEVNLFQLDTGSHEFLTALMQGENLGGAMAAAQKFRPDFDPAELLTLLIRHQAITDLHTSQGETA